MSVGAFVGKMRIVRRLLFVTLVCLVIAVLVFIPALDRVNAWSSDSASNTVICAAGGDQSNPVAVSNGSGGVIIAWQDYRSGGNWDIYCQRVDSAGATQWVANGIAICTASSDQTSPAVVSDGSGGAIIAWQDRRNSNFDIYVQRIGISGVTQWTTNGIAICTASYDQICPILVSDGAGGAIIIWQDRRNNSNYDLYAQRISASGIPQWTENGVAISTAPYDQLSASAISDGSGGAIIAWQDKRNCNYDIYGQRVNSAGAPQWTANGIAICTISGYQLTPATVSDGSGGAIITWQDYRSGTNYDVYGQRVNSAGTAQWSANGVPVCTAANDQTTVTAVSDGSGGAIIAWQDKRTGISHNIYAQRMSSTGAPQWTADGAPICTAPEDQISPIILSDGSGGAIIVWRDARSSTNYDIYGQRVDLSATVHWGSNGMAICTAADDQSSLSGAVDGSGSAIVTWEDSRNVIKDIYAQKIYASGALSRPPNQPSNLSPVDLAAGISFTPALQCSAFSPAETGGAHAASQWRIRAAVGDYDSPVFDSGTDPFSLRQVTVEADKLNGNSIYYWQVRHQDNYGAWSEWSVETCFTTLNQPPNQPAGVSPAACSGGISLTPTLQSSKFSDPDSGDDHAASQWRITTTPGDYSKPVLLSAEVSTNLTQIAISSGFLAGNATYHWQVRHKDNHGSWSAWSEEKSFTTLSQPPNQPLPVSPPTGTTGTCLSPALQASAFSDPDAGDTHAASQWQIATTADNYTNPVYDYVKLTGPDLTCIVVQSCILSQKTTYYWRVRYQDNHGIWSEWSESAYFTTQEIPEKNSQITTDTQPDQPSSVEPKSGAKNVSTTPTLESSPFHDPDAGDSLSLSQWQITTVSGDYTNPVFDKSEPFSSIIIPPGTLEPDTTYYWRIRHQDSHGAWSDWSEEASFTTKGVGGAASETTRASWIYIAAIAGVALLAIAAVLWRNNRAAKMASV